jgi:hypothetical protein
MSDQDPTGDPTQPHTPTPDGDPTEVGPPVEDPGDPTQVDTPVADTGDPTMAMPVATAGVPPGEPPAMGEPPAEPPDRRRWILLALLAIVAILALLLILFRDDDDDVSSESTTTTSSTTTTESTTTTTAPPATTTTAPPATTTTAPTPTTVDPARCVSSAADDPDTTAELVYDAYTVADRDCASNVMTSSALDQLFGIPGAGGGWTFMGCEDVEDPEPQTLCSYRFEGGSTTFRMNHSDAEGWTVFEVFQTAD